MIDPDDVPQHAVKKLKPLDKLSIDELNDYIREMKEEILRVEQEIVRKQKHRDAMASLFKK